MTERTRDELSQEAPSTSDQLQSTRPESTAATPGAVPTPIQVSDADAFVCYANFCRVTGTPEELILDFGLNAQPMGAATDVEIKQRLVVNYFTAKRLLHALAMSIQRHENAFGVLETDIQKRVSPSLRRAAAPS